MWIIYLFSQVVISVPLAIENNNSTTESVGLFGLISEWFLPGAPVIIALIALVYTIRAYNRNKRKDSKVDKLQAMDIVNSVQKEIVQKVRSAAVGLPNSGLSREESQKLEEQLQKAQLLAPKSSEVWSSLGALYDAMGRLSDSEKAYSKAVKLSPKDPMMHIGLLVHCFHRGKDEKAEKVLARVKKLGATSPNFLLNLGMCLKHLNKLEEAEKLYLEGIELDRNNSQLWYNLGLLLTEKNDFHGALKAYKEGIRINPNDPELYLNLGNTLIMLNRLDEAISQLLNSIRLDESYDLPYRSLAYAYNLLELPDKSNEAHKKFEELRRSPHNE